MLEVETDLGGQFVVGKVGTQLSAVAFGTGGFAEQGKADGVKNGGLAGAGGTVDEKQRALAELAKVEGLGLGKGAEGLEFEEQGTHRGKWLGFQCSVFGTREGGGWPSGPAAG